MLAHTIIFRWLHPVTSVFTLSFLACADH